MVLPSSTASIKVGNGLESVPTRYHRCTIFRRFCYFTLSFVVVMVSALTLIIDRRVIQTIIFLQSQRLHHTPHIILGLENVDAVQDHRSNSTLYTPMVLDLLGWETQSIREFDNVSQPNGFKVLPVCKPPEGINDTCCLGSVSARGGLVRGETDHCFKDDGRYDKVAQAARKELQCTSELVKDVSECDLCRIMNIIHHHDLKFAVTGDSMMLQMFSGMWCELSRRGYNVVDNTKYIHAKYNGIRSITVLEVTGPTHWTKPVRITYLSQYKPKMGMSEIKEIAETYNIVVMNFGIHWSWTRRIVYQIRMAEVFNTTIHGAALQMLAYRESSAQHFGAVVGEWSGDVKVFPCYPLPDNITEFEQFRWRERVIHNTSTQVGYKVIVADESLPSAKGPAGEKELVILPFYNFTMPLHYLHPEECTHFCSTPFLWMPTWRSLRLAMDRQWI